MIPNEHVMAERTFIPIQEIQRDLSKQFIIIKFRDTQQADYQYNIHIKYIGKLQDNMEGFYKSSYNIGNTTR